MNIQDSVIILGGIAEKIIEEMNFSFSISIHIIQNDGLQEVVLDIDSFCDAHRCICIDDGKLLYKVIKGTNTEHIIHQEDFKEIASLSDPDLEDKVVQFLTEIAISKYFSTAQL